jgi:phenylalanyl-tRNA synthetase beta chain
VVDITNYVMLALGSPLHAYDRETLHGDRILVRRATPGEKIVTLDGTSRELDPSDLVIADADRPIGLAGVMGGENTEVSDSTTTVVLETANFDLLTVLRSGARHHMRSEAQTRWEKGVDPQLAGNAATYASQLLVELSGASWTGETEVRGDLPAPPVIAFRPGYTNEVLGLEVPEDEQRERLGRLGFEVDADWTVHSPTWRARDVHRDIDVVEEVARFRLEHVPATLPVRQAMFGRLTHEQRLRRRVADVLAGAGLYEAYTYSLQPSDPDPTAIELPVPLSSQQRVLRTTLRVGLAGAATVNVDAGNADVSLFEIAHVYLPPGPIPTEHWRVGGIVQGSAGSSKGSSSEPRDSWKRSSPSCRSSRCSRGRKLGPSSSSALRCRAVGSRPTARASSTASGARSSSALRCRAVGSRPTARASSTASGARSSSTSRSCSRWCRSGSSTAT